MLLVIVAAAALLAFSCATLDQSGPRVVTIENGFTVAALRKPFRPNAAEFYAVQTAFDTGGTTSVRYFDNPQFKADDGYYERSRDLGQIFTIHGKDVVVDAIVLRTGPSDNAVKAGAAGAALFVQFFEVLGEPRVNDNGTPPGTDATHGFTKNHRADDFVEGIRFESIAVVKGGRFPAEIPPTGPSAAAGKLHYFILDFVGRGELRFSAGRRYAFMLGFTEPGPDRSFSLANRNLAADPAPPSLEVGYLGGLGIRREGDGKLPPGPAPENALFPLGHARYFLSPRTEGYPDVDTYRDLEFYLRVK